jgi:hypothetical protein
MALPGLRNAVIRLTEPPGLHVRPPVSVVARPARDGDRELNAL